MWYLHVHNVFVYIHPIVLCDTLHSMCSHNTPTTYAHQHTHSHPHSHPHSHQHSHTNTHRHQQTPALTPCCLPPSPLPSWALAWRVLLAVFASPHAPPYATHQQSAAVICLSSGSRACHWGGWVRVGVMWVEGVCGCTGMYAYDMCCSDVHL